MPFAAVHGLADLRQVATFLEDGRAVHVAQKIAALDTKRAVIPPFIRIADLVDHRVQFGERLLLGFGAHPRQVADLVFHRLLDLLRHFDRLRLHRRPEGFLHEDLS